MRLWTLPKLGLQPVRDAGLIDLQLAQDFPYDPVAQCDECRQHMFGLDLWMVHLLAELLCADEGFLRLFGVPVDVHT